MKNETARKDVATDPLGIPGKTLAFLGGSVGWSVVSLLIAANASTKFFSRGATRKAADVWKWFGMGFLSAIALGALIHFGLI